MQIFPEAIALIITLGISAALKVPFLKTPLDRDYGIYGYHALGWLRQGRIPYVDMPEGQPPGRWLLYALLLKYFSVSRHVFRISNMVFLLLTQSVIFLIAERLFGATIGAVASLSFAVLTSLPAVFWVQSSAEIQQALFTSLAIYGIVASSVDNYLVFYFIGVSAFASLFFKQTAYINTFPVISVFLYVQKAPMLNIGVVCAGVLSGYFFAGIFFVVNKIPLNHYIRLFALDFDSIKIHLGNFLYFKRIMGHGENRQKIKSEGSKYNSKINTTQRTLNTAGNKERTVFLNKINRRPLSWLFNHWVKKLASELLLQSLVFVLFSVVGVLTVFCGVSVCSAYMMFWIWLGMGTGAVILNQHFMPYHFLPLLSPLSILAAVGMIGSATWLQGMVGIGYNAGIYVALCAVIVCGSQYKIREWLKQERQGRGKIYTHGADWLLNAIGELIGRHIKTKTHADDQIYVWGSEYEIYLWAERFSPIHSLECLRPEVSFIKDPLEREAVFVEMLTRFPPKYIAVCTHTDGFKKFTSFLGQYYFLESKAFGETGIYRRSFDPALSHNQNNRNYLFVIDGCPSIFTLNGINGKNNVHSRNAHNSAMNSPAKKEDNFVRNPLVSIIILTCNALEYTRMCIKSIQNHTIHPYEIIFVDNGSTDGTIDFLEKIIDQNTNYKLIKNNENKGFSAGNNLGIAAAKGTYVMLLNNDVLVSDYWLRSMVRCIEKDEKIGMVGPITNFISGRQAIKEVPYSDENGFYDFANKLREHNKGRLTPRRRIAGFALLMKKTLYEELGGLDETFGIGNFEDDDLCVRARQKGYAIMVDESAYIHHFGNQTFKANKMNYQKNLNEKLALFNKKWPEVDYSELLELRQSLEDSNRELCVKGKQALDAGNIEDARVAFMKVLLSNPIDSNALSGICVASLIQGSLDNAYKYFIKMMDIVSETEGSSVNEVTITKYLNMGNAYFQKGEYSEAIDAYRKVIEINPLLTDVYHQLSLAYTNSNQLDDAILILREAIDMWKIRDSCLRNNVGVMYFKNGQYIDARNYFIAALIEDPHYHEALQNLEKVLRLLGKESQGEVYDTVISMFRDSLYWKIRDSRLCNNMGVFYGKNGQYNNACNSFKEALTMNPYDKEAQINLEEALNTLGEKNGL
ncbi:MAG: glycosyltransferase [Candidatus Brocadiaceae bacterium]|nr:glycosyltransferase [Candidatus Brocadiaceae bacterium]